MSVIHSREVARKIARHRAGLAFIDERSSHAPHGLPGPSLRLREDMSSKRRVIRDRTHGLATRKPPLRNMANARGWTFFEDIKVYHESELEHRVSLRLQVRNDVAELHSQYPVFRYMGDEGKLHEHTADFYVVYKDGYRQAVVVKQEKKRNATEALIESICAHPSFLQVDGIILLTEKYGNIEALENAMMVRWSREYHDQDDVDELLGIVAGLTCWFRFGSLLRNCVSIERRRVAVWRLIEAGILFSPTGEKISDLSFLGYESGGGPTGLLG